MGIQNDPHVLGSQNRMVQSVAGVEERSPDILGFQVGQFLQDLFCRKTCSQQIQYVRHANPHVTNTRLAAALLGIEADPIEVIHCVS